MDMISKLPSPIIENILSLLSTQEAARTSILSKEWRYHWIRISKLTFIQNTFQVTTNIAELAVSNQTRYTQRQRNEMVTSYKRCKFFSAIYQVLLTCVGPIHEFTLSGTAKNSWDEIDRILGILSQNETIKKLKLEFISDDRYTLPLSVFSFRQLTDLYLYRCNLDEQPSSHGLDSLTSLYVEDLRTSSVYNLLHFLSKCPLLKTVTLKINFDAIESYSDEYSTINLFERLPMIENLFIRWDIIQFLDIEEVPHELPTKLVHLKYLCIEDIILIHEYKFPLSGFPILIPLIKSSPNLEKLTIQISDYIHHTDDESFYNQHESGPFTLEFYTDIWLEHLSELEIIHLNFEAELDFVKFILARSPKLKKLRIILCDEDEEDVEYENLPISEILLCSPKASPVVEIIVGLDT